MAGLFKSSVQVTIINLFGLGLNFLLNLVLAAKFGVGMEMDSYLVATAVPTYIITILSGSLSVTFIPVFIGKKEREEKWSVLGSILLLGALAGAVISVLIFLFSRQLIGIQSPGFSSEVIEYSSFLLRSFSIVVCLTIINEIIAGTFYAQGEYVVPMLNRVISPLVTISIIFAVNSPSALTIIVSTVAGTLLQTIQLAVHFLRRGYRLNLDKHIFSSEVNMVLKLMIPLLAGSMFYKFLPVFDKFVLSDMTLGSVSVINYSQKLFLAATQVVGAALSMQIFTHMSELYAKGRTDELKTMLNSLFRLILFIAVPVMGICFLFSPQIIQLMYERGEFSAINTAEVAVNFRVYILAVPAVLLGTLISQGLYALKDTWSPFFVGLAEIFLYGAVSLTLISRIGILSLPTAYVTYFYFSSILLGYMLYRKIPFIRLKEFFLVVMKYISLIAIEMALFYNLLQMFSMSPIGNIVLILLAFCLYLGTAYVLGFAECRQVIDKLIYEANKYFRVSKEK